MKRRTALTGISIGIRIGLVTFTATGCTGGTASVPPITFTTAPPVASDSATPPATSAPATTNAPTKPATTSTVAAPATLITLLAPTSNPPLTGPMFSPDLGTKVDTAPGVTTRGDTRKLLDEGLWAHIPWEIDPNDLSQLSVNPEDVPIIEAYVRANIVYYRAALGQTTTDDPDFAKYSTTGGHVFDSGFNERKQRAVILSLGSGALLRPYVLGDNRTETTAVIFDCELDDEQEIPIGGTPKLHPMHRDGQYATMVKVGGQWKIDKAGLMPSACL